MMHTQSSISINIGERVLYDFLCISTNLNERLGFDNVPYFKSFMSLVQIKDYTYMITNDDKVLYGVLIHPISFRICCVAWPSMGFQLNLSIGLN